MTRSTANCASPLIDLYSSEPTDEALTRHVRRQLDRCGYMPLRLVRISATGRGCVHLDGNVQSFYLKQVAQTAALAVEGVVRVENRLQVCGVR